MRLPRLPALDDYDRHTGSILKLSYPPPLTVYEVVQHVFRPLPEGAFERSVSVSAFGPVDAAVKAGPLFPAVQQDTRPFSFLEIRAGGKPVKAFRPDEAPESTVDADEEKGLNERVEHRLQALRDASR